MKTQFLDLLLSLKHRQLKGRREAEGEKNVTADKQRWEWKPKTAACTQNSRRGQKLVNSVEMKPE